MRSVAYGLTALSPGVGQAEDFIEKKGIPDDQVPAFLAKFGDPQLAGLIAQKQRLKQIQSKMPPPGGPQAAPPTVKDDINMQVMRALNPTPNNPQPQAGQQPGQPPQGGPPPGGQPPQGGPPPGGQPPQAGGPPVQAAAGGLMGYGIGGLDAGAMEAPRHFDDGGIVAFAGGGSYKDVTDTATAQHEADLAGVPMEKRWTDAKEAEWRRYRQMELDNTKPSQYANEGMSQDEYKKVLELDRTFQAIKPRYDLLTTERNEALDRQRDLPNTNKERIAKQYGVTLPTNPIAPPAEEEEEVVEDTPVVKETPKVSSSAPSSAASSPGIPKFDIKNDELANEVRSTHEKVSGAYDQLYKDVKEAKPTLLEEDTEGLKFQKDTAEIKLKKAQEKFEEAKGYGARKKAIDQAMYDAQRGLGTSSIFWRSVSAWRNAKEAAEDAKDAADLAYRDQIQAVLDAKQKRVDDNTKESQTFYRAQLEKLGTITLQKATADETHAKTLAEIQDKGIGRQLEAERNQITREGNLLSAQTTREGHALQAESNKINRDYLNQQRDDTYRMNLQTKADTQVDKEMKPYVDSMQYTEDQLGVIREQIRTRVYNSPGYKKVLGDDISAYNVRKKTTK